MCVFVGVCVHALVIKPAPGWCFRLSMDHNEQVIWIAVLCKPAPVHMVYMESRLGIKKKKKTSIFYLLGFCICWCAHAHVHSTLSSCLWFIVWKFLFMYGDVELNAFENTGRETCGEPEQWLSPRRKVEEDFLCEVFIQHDMQISCLCSPTTFLPLYLIISSLSS